MLVPVVLQAVLMLCGLGIQTAKGYHHYELGLYLEWLFGLQLVDTGCLRARDHRAFARQPEVSRSFRDGRRTTSPLTFASVCSASSTTSTSTARRCVHLFGHERLRPLPGRVARVRRVLGGGGAAARRRRVPVLGARHDERLARPHARSRARGSRAGGASAGAAALVAMAALGGFIFYNTNILNHYVTTTTARRARRNTRSATRRSNRRRSRRSPPSSLAVDLYPDASSACACRATTRWRTARQARSTRSTWSSSSGDG